MRKHQTAMNIYNGHKGESTVKAVWSFVPQELKDRLTGKELGMVLNAAYQAGKASTGAEKIDNNALLLTMAGPRNFDKNSQIAIMY